LAHFAQTPSHVGHDFTQWIGLDFDQLSVYLLVLNGISS